MSNHTGSHMLNNVLKMLERYGVFEFLGEARTDALVMEIVRLGGYYDCNDGEMLHEIGERLGVCYACLNKAQDFKEGVCHTCREEWGWE
jgi:hypothetical protein